MVLTSFKITIHTKDVRDRPCSPLAGIDLYVNRRRRRGKSEFASAPARTDQA